MCEKERVLHWDINKLMHKCRRTSTLKNGTFSILDECDTVSILP